MLKKTAVFFRRIWGGWSNSRHTLIPGLVLTVLLILIPTGFEDAVNYQGADKVKAVVTAVDNSAIHSTGLIRSGEQVCTVDIQGGRFRGKTAKATNLLSGSLSQDKEFSVGDEVLVTVSSDGASILSVTMVDHYRVGWELLLVIAFSIFLIAFAGPGGIRAMLSFVITVLCIWKVMIPYCLRGGNAILCGLCIITLLTAVIILFVYGFDGRSIVAISGSLLGVVTACVFGILFTRVLHIHGAIMADSESLLYAGYEHLNLTQIFMASIFIGASGAMMDLSVDITSGMYEVLCKRPDIGRLELIGSGIRIGQAAMGTMTTTLLLAYAGGCITQLMVFMAQGTPMIHILNYKYVAGEILKTLVGSFALVTVAPFTALAGGVILQKQNR